MTAILTAPDSALTVWRDVFEDKRVIEALPVMAGLPASMGPLGLTLAESATPEQCEEALNWLLTVNLSSPWLIGDLANQFRSRHGKRYGRLMEALKSGGRGRAYQTVANARWVCSAFDISRRRENNLTFGHHETVAGWETHDEQDFWLDRAERDGLSVAKLREAIREAKRPALNREAPELEETGAGVTMIPGQTFLTEGGEIGVPHPQPVPPQAGDGSPVASGLQAEEKIPLQGVADARAAGAVDSFMGSEPKTDSAAVPAVMEPAAKTEEEQKAALTPPASENEAAGGFVSCLVRAEEYEALAGLNISAALAERRALLTEFENSAHTIGLPPKEWEQLAVMSREKNLNPRELVMSWIARFADSEEAE